MQNTGIDVILLAAGKGTRAGLGYPKQFARLGGKPILVHTLEIFHNMPEVDRILLTCSEESMKDAMWCLKSYDLTRKTQIIEGGATRQQSVYNALQKVKAEKIIVHEAVRPFITQEFTRLLLKEAEGEPGAVPVTPVPYTVGLLAGRGYTGCADRQITVNVQLPQVFDAAPLKEAHEKFKDEIFYEDAIMVVNLLKKPLKTVPGLDQNIKITTPLDLLYAEVLYREGYCGSNRGE